MPTPGNFQNYFWAEPKTLKAVAYVCGYCGMKVSSDGQVRACL